MLSVADCILREYLDVNPRPTGFYPEPSYCPDGDYISCFLSEEMCYAESIDDFLTVYREDSSGRIVGYRIAGVIADIRERRPA